MPAKAGWGAIRNSLIACRFYEVVESDTPEFQTIARQFAEHTRIHVQILRREAQDPRDPFG